MSDHVATVEWSRGDQAFADNRYSRAHDWTFDGGTIVLDELEECVHDPARLATVSLAADR